MRPNNPAGINREAVSNPTPMRASLLREEISFWQEILAALEGADHPRESVERAQQALALAQYRLALVMPRSSH